MRLKIRKNWFVLFTKACQKLKVFESLSKIAVQNRIKINEDFS